MLTLERFEEAIECQKTAIEYLKTLNNKIDSVYNPLVIFLFVCSFFVPLVTENQKVINVSDISFYT